MMEFNTTLRRNLTTPEFTQISAVLYLMTIIGSIATIGNVTLLCVILRQVISRRSGSQILVANLALTFVLIGFPLTLSFYDSDIKGQGLSPLLCKTQIFAMYVCLSASMWTDVCLGFNRLVAIYRPHKYSLIAGNKLNLGLVAFSWVISIFIILPIPFLEGGKVHQPPRGLCLNYQTTNRIADWLFTSFTIVPYALISAASMAVVVKSIRIHRSRQQQIRGDPSHDSKEFNLFSRRLHVAKMLFFSFVWSSTCQLPVFLVVTMFPDWLFGSPVASSWINCTIALEYAGNPLIFFAMSKDYRDGFRQLLCKSHGNRSQGSAVETQLSRTRRPLPTKSCSGNYVVHAERELKDD